MPGTPSPSDADVWLLAGQSNMAGSGFGEAYEPPSDRVWLFDLQDRWRRAEEPFAVDRYEAVDEALAIMRGEMAQADRDENYRSRAAPDYRRRLIEQRGGGGLGLAFGKAVTAFTGRPVGLLFCAKGDTRMAEWDPDHGGSRWMGLYRATVRRIRAAGRRLTGVVWYQGESDTFDGQGVRYAQAMRQLVSALRRDTGQADLPFFYVQIATCALQTEDELPEWNLVQDTQLRLEPALAPGGLCAAIDLRLCDGIHLATSSQQRLGRRLARLVRARLYGDASVRVGPRPVAIQTDPERACRVRVRFASVNGRLLPHDRVAGFWVQEGQEDRNLVCAACVLDEAPDTVELILNRDMTPSTRLWYGKGMAPFCNLADEQDLAAPVFGPRPIDPAGPDCR